MRVGFVTGALMLAPVLALAQGKLPLGFGGGGYMGTAGGDDVGDRIDFAHAIAYRAYEGDDRSRRFTVVLLSDTPIPEPKAQDEDYVATEARAGRLKALQVRLANADGRITTHAVFDTRGRTPLEAPEHARFTRTTFTTTRVEGQIVFSPAADASVVAPRGYTAFFNARVRQGPWVEPGEARGTLTTSARAAGLHYAALFEDPDTTTVVVSNVPLPVTTDRDTIAALARQQGVVALWTTVERKTGTVVLARCLAAGLPGGDAEAAAIEWHREDWGGGLMRGRLATRPDAGEATCVADVYFAARRR